MSDILKVSVGVIARNEEARIAAALESILQQTVFRSAKSLCLETELIVVAHGCTDQTVERSEAFLQQAPCESAGDSPVRLRLEAVPEAGVANAWNLLTHTFSRPDTDFIFFVNADIVIDQPDAFEQMLRRLQREYVMKGIVPVGRTPMEAAQRQTLPDRLQLALTRFAEGPVRGHCLCARAAAARAVWLPKRLPGEVEECFQRMILSDMAAIPENPARIGVAQNAGYTFEACRSFRDMAFRRVRRFVGQAFLQTLLRHLKTMRTEQPGIHMTAYLRVRDELDPSWLDRLVQLSIHVHGLYQTLPSPASRFRFWRQPENSLFKKLSLLPGAVTAFMFDVPVFLSAAWHLKTGRVSAVWNDTPKPKTH